jgi:hypothetical protein
MTQTMKKHTFYTLCILLISLLSSCDAFLDVNSNPNSPITENLPLSAKLPAALVSTVNQETQQINLIGGFWGGYWGTSNEGVNQYFDLKTYNGPGIRSQREGIPVWENGYNNILYFRLIQEEAEKENALFYSGVSKIMQGMLFLRLVDFYNNIPVDEAAQGNTYLNPVYESGEVVYQKSIALITEGMTDLKASETPAASNSGDLMFAGNISKWLKFANTVKLRALIRQSEKGSPTYITEQIRLIEQEGSGYLTYGENAAINPGYLNSAGKLNPLWENYYRDVQGKTTANHLYIRPTEFLVSQLVNRNDPRAQALYLTISGKTEGVIFGNPDAGNSDFDALKTSSFKGPTENANQPTGIFHSISQSSILISSAESLFLQAEAASRGWITADVKGLYEQGIKASFEYYKVNQSLLTNYLTQESVDLNQAANPIERIIGQKWLALNSVSSIEAWNDYRRLGFPEFPATAATGVNGRPQRLMYPETERGTNLENVQAQGSDLISEKVWWMK